MPGHGPAYLLGQLLNNTLSKEELNEFLAGLENDDSSRVYSDELAAYFQTLITQHESGIRDKPLPDRDVTVP